MTPMDFVRDAHQDLMFVIEDWIYELSDYDSQIEIKYPEIFAKDLADYAFKELLGFEEVK